MCGIIGIVGSKDLSEELFRANISLQHRGQDASGMFSYDETTREACRIKELGLSEKLWSQLKKIRGDVGIGHVRYPTAGTGNINDAQPIYATSPNGIMAIVQNGNVVNYPSLRLELERECSDAGTHSDGEAILNIMNKPYDPQKNLEENILHSVSEVYRRAIGSYSMICFNRQLGGLIAFRDPRGIKPLIMGERKIEGQNSYGFASEDEILHALGFNNVHSLEPGVVAMVGRDRRLQLHQLENQTHAHCMFEYFYFAGPESCLEEINVMEARKRAGIALAKKVEAAGIHLDMVVPVPDTGRTAAIAASRYLGIPFEEGLIKNRYVGRSFIDPDQESRIRTVGIKFKPVRWILQGKDAFYIDDSIVRGTTSRKLVRMLRSAGARKVYFGSTLPIVSHPCYYGIDFQQGKELIGSKTDLEGIRREIEADGLFFNLNSELREIVGLEDICDACCTGRYPTDISEAAQLGALREEAQRKH
ncbi:MAG: amidophosphoribosyltransferase [Candidatus Woesearchaeota archaeon]|jgi:amidophosphoribosyltransferase